MKDQNLTPEAAVDELIALHATAIAALKSALDRYLHSRAEPNAAER